MSDRYEPGRGWLPEAEHEALDKAQAERVAASAKRRDPAGTGTSYCVEYGWVSAEYRAERAAEKAAKQAKKVADRIAKHSKKPEPEPEPVKKTS